MSPSRQFLKVALMALICEFSVSRSEEWAVQSLCINPSPAMRPFHRKIAEGRYLQIERFQQAPQTFEGQDISHYRGRRCSQTEAQADSIERALSRRSS
ncbi:MAG: hypothetical protein ACLQIQ_06005 [Beijerinckiaceae bacterium]